LADARERVPITRVYDATRLDWLGVPVWAAVTPLALDLTVHAGKGATPQDAQIGAVMEAIERVCAERIEDSGRVRDASYLELLGAGEPALDPESFDLPFETAYRPDRRLSWIRGRDLIGRGERWLALDLVLSPAREGICTGVETNGLAAGADRAEATLHALYELIERDALAHERFARLYADEDRLPPIRVIDRELLPEGAGGVLRRLRDRGIQGVIQDLTHDLGVPVLRATLFDPAFPGREGRATAFEGLGCDLDPVAAATAAVYEAVQAHTVTVLGARDAIEDASRAAPLRRDTFLRRLTTETRSGPLPPRPPSLPDESGDRVELVLGRLSAAGLGHCVAVDLTRPDLGIPVVRVLAPGLAGPFGQTSRRPAQRLLRMLV
jgi:YcaO-like protein with predicted kinase domain